jgi:hypothetical protein
LTHRCAIFALTVGLGALGLTAPAAAGTLPYNIKLEGTFHKVECAVADGPYASCFSVDYEEASWPGIGLVSLHEDVVQSGLADRTFCEPQVRRATLTASRGTIRFLAAGTSCPGTQSLVGGYFAVSAAAHPIEGTGAYVGVTGSNGTVHVRPDEEEVYTRFQGVLDVPGLAFDTTAPVFSALPRAIRMRAERAIVVRYAMPTAADAADGPLTVRCTPQSGSRFKVGRTIVRCSATDTSGNTAVATFVVTVTRRRR